MNLPLVYITAGFLAALYLTAMFATAGHLTIVYFSALNLTRVYCTDPDCYGHKSTGIYKFKLFDELISQLINYINEL